jgi:hypothetical protein
MFRQTRLKGHVVGCPETADCFLAARGRERPRHTILLGFFEVRLDFLERLTFGFWQEKCGRDQVKYGACSEAETVGRNTAAIVVETA